MRRTILWGLSVMFVGGCGGGGSTGGTGGKGGSSVGGTGGGVAGTTGTAGTGTAGTAGTGTGGAAGTSSGGTSSGGTAGGGGAGGAGGTGPRMVTLQTLDGFAFAAYQDGNSTWQSFAGGVGANFTFAVTGERYGVAYGCLNVTNDNIGITVIQATVAETTRVTAGCGGLSTATPVTIMGTIAGLSSTQTAQVDIGSKSAAPTAAAPTFSISLPPGTFDLFARRMTAAPVWDRMIRRNGVTVAMGATFNLDFATDGFAPETHTITFQGVSATETTGVLVIFRNTLGGSPFGLGSPSAGSFFSIPATQLRTGDYHSIVASASDPATGGRRVRRIAIGATDFTASMPPMIAAPVLGVGATTPYVRPRGTIPAGLTGDQYALGYSQTDTAPARSRSWALQLTKGWIASAGATDYTAPDLSGVTGWQTWWGLAAGATNWQQFSNTSSAGVADLLRADQTAAELDGREYKITQRDGTVTF